MRILIVEDEHKIANALKRGLEQQAFAADVAYDGDEGLSLANSEPYDLIILDRMLPGSIDGIGILKELREKSNHMPVLLLTAKDKILDKAYGLNSGADDYLVKPFAFVEFIARVRALLRRPKEAVDDKLVYKELKLNLQTMQASRNGKYIDLSVKEFALLEYLMRNPEKVISKNQIIGHVWNYDADVLLNTVEVYIGYLRKKIDKPFGGTNYINTRRGFGYIFGESK
ncbi:MAG: response regulator transcription factor [Patescibacteria group bacterium]|jgi:DNA-binding response OmpR family regulator